MAKQVLSGNIKSDVRRFIEYNSIGGSARIFNLAQLREIDDFLKSEIVHALVEHRNVDAKYLERERARYKSRVIYTETGTTQKRLPPIKKMRK